MNFLNSGVQKVVEYMWTSSSKDQNTDGYIEKGVISSESIPVIPGLNDRTKGNKSKLNIDEASRKIVSGKECCTHIT